MKILPVGAELFYADRWTDGRTTDRHDEANSRSSQFCERALKWKRQYSGPNYSRHSYDSDCSNFLHTPIEI